MRHIDSLLKAVADHPYLSEVEKDVLIFRLEQQPTKDELIEASARVTAKGKAQVPESTVEERIAILAEEARQLLANALESVSDSLRLGGKR